MADHIGTDVKARLGARQSERDALRAAKSRGETPHTIAGFRPAVGPRDPKGSYVNRSFVEGAVASRGEQIPKLQLALEGTERELANARLTASTTTAKSEATRARISQNPWTEEGGQLRLDSGKESAHQAAGWNEYRANERVRSLERNVTELKQRLSTVTKEYDTYRVQLRENPKVEWFHY